MKKILAWLKKHEGKIIIAISLAFIIAVGVIIFETTSNRIDEAYNTSSKAHNPYGPYSSGNDSDGITVVGPTNLLPPLVCLLIAGAVIYLVGLWHGYLEKPWGD